MTKAKDSTTSTLPVRPLDSFPAWVEWIEQRAALRERRAELAAKVIEARAAHEQRWKEYREQINSTAVVVGADLPEAPPEDAIPRPLADAQERLTAQEEGQRVARSSILAEARPVVEDVARAIWQEEETRAREAAEVLMEVASRVTLAMGDVALCRSATDTRDNVPRPGEGARTRSSWSAVDVLHAVQAEADPLTPEPRPRVRLDGDPTYPTTTAGAVRPVSGTYRPPIDEHDVMPAN